MKRIENKYENKINNKIIVFDRNKISYVGKKEIKSLWFFSVRI